MRRVTPIAILLTSMGLIAGCVKQSAYDASQAQLADVQRQLAETQRQLADAQKRATDTQSKLDQAQQQLADANEQLSVIQSQMNTAKPVPVRVAFRKPMGLPNTVFMSTTLGRELPVTLTIVSHEFGSSEQFNLFVPPVGELQFSIRNGKEIEEGDQIRTSNPDFEPETLTFHVGR